MSLDELSRACAAAENGWEGMGGLGDVHAHEI